MVCFLKGKVMKRILLAAIMVLLSIGSLNAMGDEKKLGITFERQYHSMWLSKGARGYGQHGALFETIDLDFYGSGFGVKTTHRSAIGSGYVDKERFDFRPYYKNQLFGGESYAMNYNISVGYEYYPGLGRKKAFTSFEWIYAFNWPNVMQNGIVPYYIIHYEYPAYHGQRVNYTGWVHRFGFGRDIDVTELPKPLHFSTEIAYTDGLGGADRDWSYYNLGFSTTFDVIKNLTFTPGVYYQRTIDESVNPNKNVFYCILSMKYRF